MTKIYTYLDTRDVDNSRFSKLISPFRGQSDILKKLGFGEGDFEIPIGFVMDEESVLGKGSNNIGGTVHDYFSRKNSIPVVTKFQAANLYWEFQDYTYDRNNSGWFGNLKESTYKWTKYSVVYLLPGVFFYHKHLVLASAEEIAGVKEGFYVDELKEEIKILEAEIKEAKDDKADAVEIIKVAEAKIEEKAAEIEVAKVDKAVAVETIAIAKDEIKEKEAEIKKIEA